MKTIQVLLLLLFCFTGGAVNAQESPIYQGTVSSVEYVSPMVDRPEDMIPSDDSKKEAKDKRSLEYESLIVPGKDPQTEDDYFVVNKHKKAQSRTMPPPSLVFDAYSSGSQPTDPSLAVGPNHVMVVFNTGFTIYDKAGNQLQGQTSPNPAIFPSGGCCDLTASYDNAANRWVLSFLGAGAQIAVSDGPNPLTAGWYVYTISQINDYQKLSVWSDGYYMTDNTSGSNKVWALERDAMLVGDPNAQILGFNLPGIATSGFYSPQVLNVTDSNLPAAGGATVVYMQDDAWGGVAFDHVKLWTIDVDWNSPGSSTVSTASQIATTPFIGVFDNGSFSNLAQPNGGSSIDALQATIMNQAQFRKFPTHNSAVFNFVVDTDAGSGELAGVRWFEFRQNGDNQPWSLYQEGTYTAPDGRHAWHASLAMDANGNIGMGYSSMSGPSTPSTVRVSSYYTGRLASDPLGVMTVAENLIANGNQNFSGFRYGDYSKIDVDPSNGTSFWFINEYMNSGRKGVVGVFDIVAGPPDTQAPTDPTNLVASGITDVGATLNWNASTDNVGVAQYNIFIDGNQVGTSGSPTFNVSGLSPSTTYTAAVNAQDAAGNISGNATTSFTTLAASYCSSNSNNSSEEYIGRVQLNTIDNTSGGQNYSDFTNISTTLNEGQNYTITVTAVWPGPVYAEGYAVWIDYNNDADFTDAGELVWSQAANTNSPNSGSFTVPTGTSLTSTRMRVSMKYNGIPSSCEVFSYGEVEDYTIILNAGGDTQPPSTPANLVASNETTTTIDLDWNPSTDNVGVTGYIILQDGISVGNSPTNAFTATGLSPNTTYAFQVQAYDAAGNFSGLSNIENGTTTSAPDTQAPSTPTNLVASNETDTSIDLNWNPSSDNVGVTGYEIFQDGSSIGTTPLTSATVSGLSPNTTYDFNVRAFDAAGNNSGLSNTATATTTGGGGSPGIIAAYYFETGLEGWIDGGNDCKWIQSNNAAYEGVGCVMLRDGSNTSYSESPTLDLSANNEVTVELHVFTRSMEPGEDFFVELFDGSNYQVIGNYVSGVDFITNGFFSPPLITLTAGTSNFTTNNRIRVRCNGNANNDKIAFDQVIISGDNVSIVAPPSSKEVEEGNAAMMRTFAESTSENIHIYPNPAREEINIEMANNHYDEIMIFSAKGEVLYVADPGVEQITLDISTYPTGMYFIRFISDGLATTKRFIKH
ncbi:MAG: T9SS type A sorting domain-containing protein [Bacteroidetes bacterium]|nr:T9SS type A sorting domain-containing protein [Bacteroidota bacterium]